MVWQVIGTLVGGVSTIGTVQAAYAYGISAWIFTLGSGISCLMLGCFFARALREAGVVTVTEYLGRHFGQRFRVYSSAVGSAGMFIHIVGQFLASIAILQTVFRLSAALSVAVTAGLIGLFVVSGGITSAGAVGKIKFYMLYGIMLACAAVSIVNAGGLQNILDRLPEELHMLSLGAYGWRPAAMDMAAMIVGVLSTQIYLQAVFAAKTVREARNGAFLSAAVIPPIGILGIITGLYLRAYYPDLGAGSAQALPFFLGRSFPPIIAAFFCAGLLIIVLGTGTGLVLGVTTNLYVDFISKVRPVAGQGMCPGHSGAGDRCRIYRARFHHPEMELSLHGDEGLGGFCRPFYPDFYESMERFENSSCFFVFASSTVYRPQLVVSPGMPVPRFFKESTYCQWKTTSLQLLFC